MPIGRIRSYSAKSGEIKQAWFHVDASDQILGRLATKLAVILMGKHKPTYTPHVDTGDFVIVTNAEQIKVTGSKAEQMTYDRYSYYPGGFKSTPYLEMLEKHPELIIRHAVRRMMPKTALGRRMLMKLKVYRGTEHPHSAQQPQPLAVS